MLTLHARDGTSRSPDLDFRDAALPADFVWLDLLTPNPEEAAFVERMTDLHVPTIAELSEIESSSRVRTENDVLYLSVTLVYRATAEMPLATPVGFVLSPERLVTVRFEPLMAFDGAGKLPIGGAAEALCGLLEAIIDRIADVLEHIAAELDELSHRLFRAGPIGPKPARRPTRAAADLRLILRRVGASGDLVSKIRDSLLGLARMVPYIAGSAAWLPDGVKPRLETMRHDITSLSDYNGHLVNKVQLLLDATLGLINVEQNDIIKVLTIVSVVGIPPTLIASMYGMNFKTIPEYDWSWGYEYGLAMIAISAIAPLLWFKWRGWF